MALKALGTIGVLGTIAMIAVTPAHALSTISTIPAWNGTTGVGPWIPTGGVPGGATTVGQTFVTPDAIDTQLDSFEFRLTNPGNTGNMNYHAALYAWNGSAITGPALYNTGTRNTAADGITSSGFTTVSFLPGVNLTAGQQYYFLLTTADETNSTGPSFNFGQVSPGTYGGGALTYSQATTTAGLGAGGSPYNYNGDLGDLAFRAVFSSSANATAPEPGSIALLLPVMGAAGIVLRRRKK